MFDANSKLIQLLYLPDDEMLPLEKIVDKEDEVESFELDEAEEDNIADEEDRSEDKLECSEDGDDISDDEGDPSDEEDDDNCERFEDEEDSLEE